jgi:GntR family transcriptional regulator, transcriptional repressor for pyruvate dehydrogenase complex
VDLGRFRTTGGRSGTTAARDSRIVSLEPVARASLPTAIAERLRRRILDGSLAPGQRLPGHRELAQQFSVSVGSLREAISMLVGDGLVETRAGLGTFVAERRNVAGGTGGPPLDRSQIEELIEARLVLESELAALAARRSSPTEIAELRAIVALMDSAAVDARRFLDADVDFHLTLARATHNRFLASALSGVRTLLTRDLELSAEVGVRRFGGLQIAVAEHRAVVDALEQGDEIAARDAMIKVVARNRDHVLSLYTDPTSE